MAAFETVSYNLINKAEKYNNSTWEVFLWICVYRSFQQLICVCIYPVNVVVVNVEEWMW